MGVFRENIKTFLNDILHHVGMIPDSVDQMLATWQVCESGR